MPLRGRPRNPLDQTPDRFDSGADGTYAATVDREGYSSGHGPLVKWHRRRAYSVPRTGQSPGLQMVDSRADIQAAGTIRRDWRQTVSFVRATAPMPVSEAPCIVTRALRYKASSTYVSSHPPRFSGLHSYVRMRARNPQPTSGAGRHQSRPVLRNRMTSFGSRVKPYNVKAPGAENI